MRTLERSELACVAGGGTGVATAVRYTRACADGALNSLWWTAGVPTPQGLGVGCVAGIAGEGATDSIKYVTRPR